MFLATRLRRTVPLQFGLAWVERATSPSRRATGPAEWCATRSIEITPWLPHRTGRLPVPPFHSTATLSAVKPPRCLATRLRSMLRLRANLDAKPTRRRMTSSRSQPSLKHGLRERSRFDALSSQMSAETAKFAEALASVATGFSLFSVEWNSRQPGGRKSIAQRFIAGSERTRNKSRRDERNQVCPCPHAQRGFFRPCGTFEASVPRPSDESLGYFRLSLRDLSARPCGSSSRGRTGAGEARFH